MVSIDNFVDSGCSCTDPHHRNFYIKEWEKYRARVLSKPLPGGSILEDARFHVKKGTLKLKYHLIKYFLEEKAQTIYKALTSKIA